MAKFMVDSVADAFLSAIAAATRMSVCSAQPANLAGLAAVTLANVAMAGGDFTIADGDVSGRKVTMAAKNGVTVTANGDATHIVLDDNSTLIYGTTCNTETLSTSDTVNIPSWKIELRDPT